MKKIVKKLASQVKSSQTETNYQNIRNEDLSNKKTIKEDVNMARGKYEKKNTTYYFFKRANRKDIGRWVMRARL